MQNSSNQLNNTLFLLSAIYFLWLIAVLIIFGYTPTNDGVGYIEYAVFCLNQGQPYPSDTIFKVIPFIWNVGIINLVELSLWLTKSIWPVLLLMCLMKSLICLMTALITKKIFCEHISIITIILFICYPNNWGQSTMISSEIPSTLLILISIWLAINHRQLFVSGLILGLANWFRPTAAIFLFSIFIYFILFNKQKSIQYNTKILAGYATFIIIIGTSCYIRTGHFIYQAHSYWFSMIDECYDGAEIAPHWGQPIWPEGTPRYIENHEQMDCFDFERIWRQRSIDWLKKNPIKYLSKIPGRLYYMYKSDYDNLTVFLKDKSLHKNNYITIPIKNFYTEFSSMNNIQWMALASLLIYFIIILMATFGIYVLICQRQLTTLFLPVMIVVGGSLSLVLVMHGEPRFKDPFMPFIFILSAVGIYHIIKSK